MKRILFIFFTIFTGLNSFSQPITVNTSTYTVPQLVQDVLFAPASGGGSSCVGTLSNITWSTGTNYGSSNGIGYFQNTNPNFPLSSGVILSTGIATNSPGPNNSSMSDGNSTWLGDNQLLSYLQSIGIAPATDTSVNATILEFDFTPLTNQMSFDFLFASEEYGTFQCTFSDSFAFFLTNVTAGTPPINLALVPNTISPISVVTIRDTANNNSCGSANLAYFGSYNGGANANTSATNFNGETVLMTASTAVIPNNVYHIKLVIADRNDFRFDSAVFLGAGSFDIGSANLSSPDFINTPDFTIAAGTAICAASPIHIQAGSGAIPNVSYLWTLNNGSPISGANTFDYTVTQEGTYTVTLTYPGGCQQSDSMIVEYLPSATLGTPNDLTLCSAPFNLTNNTAVILNGTSNTISYHHSLSDAQQLTSPISNASNYPGTNLEQIYAAVEDDLSGCITTAQFVLYTDPLLCATTPVQPPNLPLCESSLGSVSATFDFTLQTPIVLGTNI
ncbi:MAG: choice-of-anchor L domain-containing protein, partial [Flavobacterium sp.]|uniref:choice-of-anchor L domain-containing protein n=1 Tax=Flavobacterium sp. TaxID=239 RepID=UPI003BE2F2E7